MVQSWNKDDKKQDDKGWLLCFLSNKEDKKEDDERWIFCVLSEKEELYSTEKVD